MADPSSATNLQQLAFEAYGVQVGVRTNDSEVLERVGRLLPPGARACDPAAAEHIFYVTTEDGARFEVLLGELAVAGDADLELALALLGTQMKECVALNAPGKVFVHAGVVAARGRAIVMPGASFAGKSALVVALLGMGATYYSDEFAVLDDRGRVHPYPSPISVRAEDMTTTDRDAESLGARIGTTPLAIGTIVVTSYRPGAEWRPRRRSAGEGVMALLANTLPAQERPAEALSALARAVDGAVVLGSERGEADEVAHALLAGLEH